MRFLLLLLLGLPTLASGATLVGIVSERSAAEVAAGAHAFLVSLPEHEVVLRTPEQLAEMPPAEFSALLDRADALLLAAVFGDQVGPLATQVTQAASKRSFPILAINSDSGITRLSRLQGRRLLTDLDAGSLRNLGAAPDPGDDARAHLAAQQAKFPQQADWLLGRAYYQGRTPEHIENLMRWLLVQAGHELEVPAPEPRALIRYYRNGNASNDPASLNLQAGPVVPIIDLDSGDRPGDRDLLDATCEALEQRGIQCFAILSRWGGASLEAVRSLPDLVGEGTLSAILSLHDFTIGGGEGRREVTRELEQLDVAVLKGIRLVDRTENQWRLSGDGMPRETVNYQLAMPELQGVSQPMVLAVASPPKIDPATGIRLALSQPVIERVTAMAERLERWQQLREKDNADKRAALVYYNHPPGRQNIGADNLDVPASLFDMLKSLKAAGYTTGDLPVSPEALLELIQQRGVNLPEDREALAEMAGQVPGLSSREYQTYFDSLSPIIRSELQSGPLGYLHARLEQAREAREAGLATEVLERGMNDLRHMLEHHEHPVRERALDLLDQYESGWRQRLEQSGPVEPLQALLKALTSTGIPGLSGWGEAPGRSMVSEGRMLFPGLQFGNVFIGPQPPRGWELDESLLHANTTFPPTHQYLGFYHWLRDHFQADALVYLGRHSTREFLPRRRAGLTDDDYPDLLGADLPLIYPYIVDGVGEGIQGKRRALGVMISHLTPPLAATELYDDLLEIRQLVETYEASLQPDSATRRRALEKLRERIENLELTEELERGIAGDLGISDAEVDLSEVSDDLLVHEAGHYTTDMQERFMPLGLHVFGRDWSDEALDTMLASMVGKNEIGEKQQGEWRAKLVASTQAERDNLLAALDGRFVAPGQGNDPIRTPDVLPTGRNFHSLSSDLIPTRVAWSLGQELASKARAEGEKTVEDSEALVLWASDTVRDEGVMIAFGLDLLGVSPRWNSRGIVNGLERLPVGAGESRPRRRDVLFTTSGLFRDLYEDQLVWLDLAVRLALQGASGTILREHPQLRGALNVALEPLPGDMREPGTESLEDNLLAARWVDDTRQLLAAGKPDAEAGDQAALRVFGTAPGAYGAGVNRLASRSGAWESRDELGQAYQRRMGHAYGKQQGGEPAYAAFEARLAHVGRTYLGRASHLYGLLDNDDGFDFQGGLSIAVEHVRGEVPDNRVLQHADPGNTRVESLERALLGEFRSRNLNPQWLKPLMDHGYAGARTMGSDFLDNLWGWQVTNPDVVRSWVWDEVNAVYFQDRHQLGLDEFLAEGSNVHVKTHMQAMALLAAQRGFWEADETTVNELARDFAALVAEHGQPGSGHTRPDHPLLDWVALKLDAELLEAFEAVRAAARMAEPQPVNAPSSIKEVAMQENAANETDSQDSAEPASDQSDPREAGVAGEGARTTLLPWVMALIGFLILLGGIMAGRRTGFRPA